MSAATIARKYRRALRNGTGLRLSPDELEVFVTIGAFELVTKAETEELTRSCVANRINRDETTWLGNRQPASRSAHSGSITGQNATTGAYAGMIAPLVQDAESQQALEAAQQTIRLSRRNRRSQSIMPSTKRPKPQRPRSMPDCLPS